MSNKWKCPFCNEKFQYFGWSVTDGRKDEFLSFHLYMYHEGELTS